MAITQTSHPCCQSQLTFGTQVLSSQVLSSSCLSTPLVCFSTFNDFGHFISLNFQTLDTLQIKFSQLWTLSNRIFVYHWHAPLIA
jgi:hypothetical protein